MATAFSARGLNLGGTPDALAAETVLSFDWPNVWLLPDGRNGNASRLLAGRTFTHRLTSDEISLGFSQRLA